MPSIRLSNETKCCFFLNKLELNIHLGWEVAERKTAQTIIVDFKIQFASPPRACQTDNLADTLCYAGFINAINQTIVGREFRLLEHLSHEIYQSAKPLLPKDALLSFAITKKPPIAELMGGVTFHYGDNEWVENS